jgi:hypothetical protein
MKNRISPLFFCIVGALVIVMILILLGKREQIELPLPGGVTNSVQGVSLPPSPTQQIRTNVQTTGTSNSAAADYHDKVVGLLSKYNDVPIDFYGRLEDQHGNPVPYAAVNFIVRVDSGAESAVVRSKTTADGNGAFNITGYRGQDLSIVPQKLGYTLATPDTFFKYSHLEDRPYVSDPNNPTVIKMWKIEGAAPLVEFNKSFKILYTNRPLFFDLVAQNIVPSGGDLEVLITRAPGVITGRKEDRVNWSVELVPVGGGIIEVDYHTAQVTFEAPAEGYQSNYSFQMNRDDPGWFDNIQKEFFLSSRNGRTYSKFSFGFEINDRPDGMIWIQFHGVANANGSRNWEATAPQ